MGAGVFGSVMNGVEGTYSNNVEHAHRHWSATADLTMRSAVFLLLVGIGE